jgi:hypothetical protein
MALFFQLYLWKFAKDIPGTRKDKTIKQVLIRDIEKAVEKVLINYKDKISMDDVVTTVTSIPTSAVAIESNNPSSSSFGAVEIDVPIVSIETPKTTEEKAENFEVFDCKKILKEFENV